MEISKLVSLMIANFKVAYPYYFKDLTDEEFIGLISLYQESFQNCNCTLLLEITKKIIRKNKFMPTIAEILDEYRKEEKSYFTNLVESSDLDDSRKKYLSNMIDWYSLKDDYPIELLNTLNKLDTKKISTEKKEALPYDN